MRSWYGGFTSRGQCSNNRETQALKEARRSARPSCSRADGRGDTRPISPSCRSAWQTLNVGWRNQRLPGGRYAFAALAALSAITKYHQERRDLLFAQWFCFRSHFVFKGAFLFVCLPCGGTYMYMLLWCVAATYPPVGCEHFVVVGLTRIEADTMTPRDYKSRKSTRLGPERVLSLYLRC
jgi:hypothetical protein